MTKVEIAKCIGLEMSGYNRIDKHTIKEALKDRFYWIETEFADDTIKIEVSGAELKSAFFNIENDIETNSELVVTQVTDYIWEQAAEVYLHKINNLVCTLNLR